MHAGFLNNFLCIYYKSRDFNPLPAFWAGMWVRSITVNKFNWLSFVRCADEAAAAAACSLWWITHMNDVLNSKNLENAPSEADSTWFAVTHEKYRHALQIQTRRASHAQRRRQLLTAYSCWTITLFPLRLLGPWWEEAVDRKCLKVKLKPREQPSAAV